MTTDFSDYVLTIEEYNLISDTKYSSTKLGFAVLLKFYQKNQRFPSAVEISKDFVEFIAKQLDLPETSHFDPNSRSAKYLREQIRKYCSSREFGNQDTGVIEKWFLTELLQFEWTEESLEEEVLEFLRAKHIERPSDNRLKRIVRSLLSKSEDAFCHRVYKALESQDCLGKLYDSLLTKGESQSLFSSVKYSYGNASYTSLEIEIAKLDSILKLGLDDSILSGMSEKRRKQIKQRLCSLELSEVRRISEPKRSALLGAFYCIRKTEILDHLTDLLVLLVQKIKRKAEVSVEKEFQKDLKKVSGNTNVLYNIASIVCENPDGVIRETVYPHVDREKIREIVKDYETGSHSYNIKVNKKIQKSYRHYYKRILLQALTKLNLRSTDPVFDEIVLAVEFVLEHKSDRGEYYKVELSPPCLSEIGKDLEREHINKTEYEYLILRKLRDHLKCKNIFVMDARKYGDPKKDLLQDFKKHRDHYYKQIDLPKDASSFVEGLKDDLKKSLESLNKALEAPENNVVIQPNSDIHVPPIKAKEDPENIRALKNEISKRFPIISLMDILKENDFRIGFTREFSALQGDERLDTFELQKKLLMVLFGYGTNTGIKRVGLCNDLKYSDLSYIRRRYFNRDNLRNALAMQTRQIMKVRDPKIWGKGSSTCAADAKVFGSWDQNIMSEWHFRYQGKGVMIYWHIDQKSACIYSQLKTCSSSEVAAMLEGLLLNYSSDDITGSYVDTRGQSEVGFGLCHLLGFNLMPRFASLKSKKLYMADNSHKKKLKNLLPICAEKINWKKIEDHYDEIVHFACTLKTQSNNAQTLLKRFNTKKRSSFHMALCEIGKVAKTMFLCRYLGDEKLRKEVQAGLNIIENWNSANSFVFYAKDSQIATNRLEEQEMCIYAIHLLQNSIIYFNTILIQNILNEKEWQGRLSERDLMALTPLMYHFINPYGSFELDMNSRIDLYQKAA